MKNYPLPDARVSLIRYSTSVIAKSVKPSHSVDIENRSEKHISLRSTACYWYNHSIEEKFYSSPLALRSEKVILDVCKKRWDIYIFVDIRDSQYIQVKTDIIDW